MIRALGALVVSVLATAPAHAQVTDKRVSLRVEGRALSEVAEYLRQQSGANIVVVEGGDTPISLDVTDVPWREALDLAAELAGCVVEERTAGVLAIDSPPRVTFSFDNADIRQIIDTIQKLSEANIVVAPEVAGTLSLHLNDVPWREALDVAVKTLGYVVVEEARGILRIADPLTLQAQMEARSYQLLYIRPPGDYIPVIDSEFVARTRQITQTQGGGGAQQDPAIRFPVIGALRKALSPNGELDYIEEKNVIIVRDTAQVHQEIQDMLRRFDVEPAQVFVDVKFVSSANSDIFSLGVDYGDLGPQVSISGGQIPITLPFNLGNGGFEDLIIAHPDEEGPFANGNGEFDVPPGNFGNTVVPDTIFGALSFTNFAATLRLLQSDSSTEIVQAPKLLVLDGREGTIFVGETIRYAEAKSEQGQAGGLQLSVAEASSSPVEVGFQLLIVPHVIPGTDKLTLDVIPKETSLTGRGDPAIAPPGFDVFTIGASGLEGTIALPRQRSSTIVTSMLLQSGQTAVVGGLSTESEIESETGIPFIRKIPILGWLFEFETSSSTKESLLVFITPSIIRSASDNQRILARELEHRREDYGNRLEGILFGDEGMPAPVYEDPVVRPAAMAPSETSTGNDEDYRWATFVQPEEQPMEEGSNESSSSDKP